ncbi:glycosyltransferase family 2 protein [Flammeovirga yaeyamensis]|uniref:Glycosyltransferase family 2 protein n=1 Tax=Flammeovirga yaeyamensis TaxID=367791 RepID=A0AAX1NDU5_9BACT|nr:MULTISPECIES: glycosyltransferase family 2 protein [Flammeovirga]ANQ52078.2 glycosyltransferase [Flammeovirga sp. MY04]MBB3699255.1 cellulose synthase/poly-beta-1,6-N-acetylglucosamine synthase-like glycosyltransferase [Flammeovirga yaeyamensis]NMF35482.1 glycosyltransferase [Flammeovirga yaeyamensis]QWG04342.1 glycosyltransferase family 2 protein [Flammeovirga yaeyamensis]
MIDLIVLKYVFWISLFIIIYSIIGYPIVLYIIVQIKRLIKGKREFDEKTLLTSRVSLVIPCYNEASILPMKIENSLQLDYPKELMDIVIVADGSTDNTPEVVELYKRKGHNITLFHNNIRAGKSAAINRVINEINTPITICTDANTILNDQSIKEIVRQFLDPKVGCVCGEKRVKQEEGDLASSGEGAYWKYESFLKKLDSELTSVMGGAGELIAFRTELYPQIPHKMILDDFFISMKILMKGFRVAYEPKAYASEDSSASVREEMKRKIRISAGGFQIIFTLLPLLNIFKYGWVTFQYVSHRVLRWLFVPFALPVIYIISLYLSLTDHFLYAILFAGQTLMYSIAVTVHLVKKYWTPSKLMMLPYYYAMMNYCAILGFWRFLLGNQSSVWEKAIRK